MAESAGQPYLREAPVSWLLSGHARRLLTLGTAGLVLAVVSGRPEFAGLAAPALLVLADWRVTRPATVTLRVGLTDAEPVEGVESSVYADIGGQRGFEAEIEIHPADDVTAGLPVTLAAEPQISGGSGAAGGAGTADSTAGRQPLRRVLLPFTAHRWGQRPVGMVSVTLRDRYRLTEGIALAQIPLARCRPHPAGLAGAIVLSRLPSRLGDHPARVAGEGVEFFGVRAFAPGDRQRRINWPATSRLGTLHLSTFAAERTQHVVVIADATADVGPPGLSSLDLVVRGASGAIRRYLTARDRVGLIFYASTLSWIGPGEGQRHFQRLIDLLVASPAGWDRASGLTRLPRAALPPGALILVFSPLLDPRLVEAIRDLRERGFSVLVVDVLNAEPGHDASKMSSLAGRIWRLEQQAIRFSLTQIGVPVLHWDGRSSLDQPLAGLTRRVLVAPR